MVDYDVYVGIDWGTTTHRVWITDAHGRQLDELAVAHSGPGLTALIAALRKSGGEPARIAAAIEAPRGAVVDTLLEQGVHVYTLNPKQVDRFRDRHTVAGAKDDRRDAFVLAEALRTDRGVFLRLQPDDPRIVQLRELSRLAEDLTQEHGRLTKRLRAQLLRVWPAVLTLCPAADEPWLWTLLERAPTPAQAQQLPRRALRAVLAAHRVRRVTAEALHGVLQEPRVPTAPGTVEAAREHITVLLPRLRLVAAQQTHCDRRLEALLADLAAPDAAEPREHRDVTILRSLPGVGRVVAATMLAEAGRPLAARDYQRLRAYTGVAPVTRQSGKTRLVSMRRSCSGRLRTAVFHWAANSIRLDPRCRAHYDRLRQRHGHARALRGVADRLLGLLVVMLSTGTLYDPARRAIRAA